jgi:hypothetical protein
VLNNENIQKLYECQEGCSGCCGPKTIVALTNSRLIVRQQQSNACCGATKGAHSDRAIFLHDIAVMRESQQATTGVCMALFIGCMTCTWPCLLCMLCCRSCCGGDKPKILEFKGAFGSENVTFKHLDVLNAAFDISSMTLPLKGN